MANVLFNLSYFIGSDSSSECLKSATSSTTASLDSMHVCSGIHVADDVWKGETSNPS